mmetsp:Transcript_22948/g.59888  ORF Transcript_22948/g.59888 Transcript_22948/m.59888 type:complete len:263 (-) Transcript_22948:2803-3591(-)
MWCDLVPQPHPNVKLLVLRICRRIYRTQNTVLLRRHEKIVTRVALFDDPEVVWGGLSVCTKTISAVSLSQLDAPFFDGVLVLVNVSLVRQEVLKFVLVGARQKDGHPKPAKCRRRGRAPAVRELDRLVEHSLDEDILQFVPQPPQVAQIPSGEHQPHRLTRHLLVPSPLNDLLQHRQRRGQTGARPNEHARLVLSIERALKRRAVRASDFHTNCVGSTLVVVLVTNRLEETEGPGAVDLIPLSVFQLFPVVQLLLVLLLVVL